MRILEWWRRLRASLKDGQIADLEEKLQKEQVRARVLQLEVDLLAAIHAGDLRRRRQEHLAERDQ